MVLAFGASCGSGDDAEETGSTDDGGEESTTTSTTEPLSDYEAYLVLVGEYGIPESELTSEAEITSVAANLCDNEVADMEFLLDSLSLLGEIEASAAEKAAVVDTYCPDRRLQLEAAADSLGIPLP